MRADDDPVLDQLRDAFPPVPIGPDEAFAPWGHTYPDAEPYKTKLDGGSWEELDAAYLLRRSDALGFLGTEHLVALLPIYLRSMLQEGVWSPAAGMLTMLLEKPASGKDTGLGTERFDALIAALTPRQRGAVAATLRAFADRHEGGSLGSAATACLESYWQQHLSPGA